MKDFTRSFLMILFANENSTLFPTGFYMAHPREMALDLSE